MCGLVEYSPPHIRDYPTASIFPLPSPVELTRPLPSTSTPLATSSTLSYDPITIITPSPQQTETTTQSLHPHLLQIPQRQHITIHKPAHTILYAALFIGVQTATFDVAGDAFLEAH